MSTGRSTEGWRVLDEAVGLVDASAHRSIVARGEERVRFLQGQLSQDIASLVTGSGAAALALNVQGRVQELFTVYAFDDRLELVVDADRLPSARARLEQFLVADDVEFDLEAPTERISLAGPGAPDLLRRAGVTCSVAPGSWSVAEGKIAGDDVRAYVRGQWRVPWIELVVVGDAAPVRRTLASLGAVPVEIDAAETVRIESGIARLGVDVDEDRIATEARLEWAIHFAKGCYVGQEVIERSVSRGRVNRELCLLSIDGSVMRGDRIEGGTEKDVVTSVALSPRAGHVALAYVPRESTVEGTRLTVVGRERVAQCRVLAWPRPRRLAGL